MLTSPLIALACGKWIVVMLANDFWHPHSALQEGCDFYVPDDRSSLPAQRYRFRADRRPLVEGGREVGDIAELKRQGGTGPKRAGAPERTLREWVLQGGDYACMARRTCRSRRAGMCRLSGPGRCERSDSSRDPEGRVDPNRRSNWTPWRRSTRLGSRHERCSRAARWQLRYGT